MRWLYKLPLRLRSLFRRGRVERELSDELHFHVEKLTEEYVARGMTPEEARYAALRDLGGAEQIKEECRDMRRVNYIDSLIQDIRYSLRMLAKNPGVTAVVVLSLAFGIGANTAIFSLLNAVVLETLPLPHPEKLVEFSQSYPDGGENSYMSWPYFKRIRERSKALSSVFALAQIGRVDVTFQGRADLATGQLATGEYFSTLGLTPAIGRFFSEEDDNGKRPVAVISYAFWQRRFGGDRSIIGKAITVNRVPLTVIGVTPATFLGLEVGVSPDITAPFMLLDRLTPGTPDWEGAFDSWLDIMGRLKPGITRQKAQAESDVIYRQLVIDLLPMVRSDERHFFERVLPKGRLNVRPGARGYEGGLRHGFTQPLGILMAMAGLVLLIACANVANLLLARATAREREMAVRLAIGARRARIVRQLLTESILLACLGGALGFLVAWWGSGAMLHMVSTGDSLLPVNVTPDLRILAFTAGVSLLTGILFGLAPALKATHVDLAPSLKEGRGRFRGQVRRRLLNPDRALVSAQIAFSLTLLVGAGLFIRTLQKLWAVNPGYDRNNLLMFSLDPRLAGYKDTTQLARLYQQLLVDLQSLPGVRSESLSLVRPVDDEAYWVNVVETIDGRKLPENQRVRVAVNDLSSGYFATMRTPMMLGREFGPEDNEHSTKVAIVSETLARQCFGNENPIGRRIADHDDPEVEIVGVAKDSRYATVTDQPRGVLYMPIFQANLAEVFFATTFEVRYAGGVSTILDEIRRQVHSLDPNLPLFRVKTLETQTRDSFVKERLIASLAGFFGVLAVLLASVGLYGTISYGVARRTGEIGVRMALGARQNDILWAVLKETLSMLAIGVAFGLPCAVAASRFMASQLFGVKPTDAPTLLAASSLLTIVALLAGCVPARRAAKINPMVALRYE
jgi:predicted permease